MNESVTITGPCPACGRQTTWLGRSADVGGGTTYSISCDCVFNELAEADNG